MVDLIAEIGGRAPLERGAVRSVRTDAYRDRWGSTEAPRVLAGSRSLHRPVGTAR